MADIELRQFVLGLTPYVVIEMREASDGSGDPALFIQAGGGAQEEVLALPLLVLSEGAPEGNPVAEMLRRLASESRSPEGLDMLENVVREFNSDWTSYVMKSG